MKKSSRQNWLTAGIVAAAVLASVALAYYLPAVVRTDSYVSEQLPSDTGSEASILSQAKTGMGSEVHTVTKIYLRDELIGVLTDHSVLSKTLKAVYKEDYAADFPGTSIGLGEDVYAVDQESYYRYEDIDSQLMDYLRENNLFSIVTNKIEFSNGAVIYVKDVDMFTKAREKYLLNFIDEAAYAKLKTNQAITPLTTYGEQDTGLSVLESMTVTQGLAPEEKILTTEDQIIQFFSYGYDTVKKEYYTCVDGDTVQGITSKASNLTAQQLITINPGVLVSDQQVLNAGTQVNITYFDSPINVVVTKERLVEENVYPEATKYIYDDTLDYGETVVVTAEVIGKRNVRYEDTYTNGVLTSGKEISSITTLQPVQKVVRVGTGANAVIAYTSGSGQFWYPVDNPLITCYWYCYSGHAAIDFQNRYNHWGLVYASDGGTVVTNSYNSLNGNYMIISHGNGFYTYYGHMRTAGFWPVGTYVEQGQAIGNIGMTGLATGPHVHFEIWIGTPYRGGRRVNPCSYLGC